MMGSFAAFFFLPILLYPSADSMVVHYGIGYSDSIDAGNPTFHTEMLIGYGGSWRFKIKHESSLLHHDEGFGENSFIIFNTWRMK